jgi:hypothetical protein
MVWGSMEIGFLEAHLCERKKARMAFSGAEKIGILECLLR